jgi:hypothetical protein
MGFFSLYNPVIHLIWHSKRTSVIVNSCTNKITNITRRLDLCFLSLKISTGLLIWLERLVSKYRRRWEGSRLLLAYHPNYALWFRIVFITNMWIQISYTNRHRFLSFHAFHTSFCGRLYEFCISHVEPAQHRLMVIINFLLSFQHFPFLTTYSITNSMEQSSLWEAAIRSATQEIPNILWNLKVDCRVKKNRH